MLYNDLVREAKRQDWVDSALDQVGTGMVGAELASFSNGGNPVRVTAIDPIAVAS